MIPTNTTICGEPSKVIAGREGKMFFCKTELTKRGWTNGLISTFLAVPDQTKPNPHYKKAAPMKLYLKTRVKQIEASETFKKAKAKAEKRTTAATKAVKTKTLKTLQFAEELDKTVAILSRQDLMESACQHYNNRALERNKDWWATPDSDEQFLNRICVNYLRHVQSEYEDSLWQLKGQTGKGKAYSIVKNNTLKNIAINYPWLAEECENQKNL